MDKFKVTYLKNGNIRHKSKEFAVITEKNKIIVYLRTDSQVNNPISYKHNAYKVKDKQMYSVYNAAKICLECNTCKYKIVCNKIIPFESGNSDKILLFHSAYCKYLNDLNKECVLYNKIEKSANKFCKFKEINLISKGEEKGYIYMI